VADPHGEGPGQGRRSHRTSPSSGGRLIGGSPILKEWCVVRIPKTLPGSCIAVAGLAALLCTAATPAAAAPDAATLYQQAMATTKAWTVHYVSTSNVSNVPFLESGDSGPASGTQTIRIGKGAMLDSASLIVIGDLTYVKGNRLAMESLTGLSPTQAATASNRWVLFSSNNPTFAQVVVGVRSHDVAQEIALRGPITLGPSRTLHGYRVEALRGTQQLQGAKKKMHAVLYVRASGTHQLVEEDTVNTQGKSNGAEHIVFSRWGESVKPKAPHAAITLGTINAT
jgi:hypothetical protein